MNRYAKDGARYFGPFGGRAQSRDIIDTVCKALLLPTCTRKFPRDIGKQRPCLNYHMGACAGWCIAGHTAEEYHAAMEQAAAETQQETPLGAYAVEYMTSAGQSRRGYYEATVKISYRRTAEQVQSLVNATSPEAVYSLLDAALDEGRTELAIRVSYWGTDGRERVEAAVEQLRKERGLEETPTWQVNYYPDSGQVGLVEFLMDSETTAAMAAPPPKDQAGETGDAE